MAEKNSAKTNANEDEGITDKIGQAASQLYNTVCETFQNFSLFGQKQSDDQSISKESIDTWLEQASILDDKNITREDTASIYSKVAEDENKIGVAEFEEFLDQLSAEKGIKKEELLDKLAKVNNAESKDATDSGGTGGSPEEKSDKDPKGQEGKDDQTE